MKEQYGAYLLSQLYDEVCERDRQRLDARFKAAYDRMRANFIGRSGFIRGGLRNGLARGRETEQKDASVNG